MVNPYTKEQEKFLLENASNMRYCDLTNLFNEKFHENKTVKQIRKWLNYHNVYALTSRDFTPEQIKYIIQNYLDKSRKELTKLFNEKFKTNVSVNSMKTYCNKRGWHSFSTGRFEQGHKSWQTGLRGEDYWKHFTPETKEQVRKTLILANTKYKDGDVIVRHGLPCLYKKVGNHIDENISYMSTVTWEKHHGPVPDTHIVIHLDGDVMNYNINNLCLLPRTSLSNLRYLGGLTDNLELNKVKLKYCELMEEIRNG